MAETRDASPRQFAGLSLARTLIMGVVNVTPDSFSDGGDFASPEAAVAHGRSLIEAGADIVDIGGESTRPGSSSPDEAEERRRVLPVVRALTRAGAVVSIDTRRATIMRAAIAEGARIVNDVSALTFDPDGLAVIAATEASVVLMHMKGDPATMQKAPHYDDAPAEIAAYLAQRAAACRAAGLAPTRIALDPGIGFGKTVTHNLQILGTLGRIGALGYPVLVGVSRKSFIAKLSRGEAAKERLPGSIAAALAAVARGADIVRVHDVAATRQALAIWHAIAMHDAPDG
jgi:dihydropteroate synthase